MILVIVIFFVTLIAKLAFDRHQHFSRKTINHDAEGAIVGVLFVVASIIYKGFTLAALLNLAEMCFTFWALFDTGFGILIASDPLFLGTSAKLDRLQKKYPPLQVLKYLLAITSIILFICLQNNK